jgi:hypothetical protein
VSCRLVVVEHEDGETMTRFASDVTLIERRGGGYKRPRHGARPILLRSGCRPVRPIGPTDAIGDSDEMFQKVTSTDTIKWSGGWGLTIDGSGQDRPHHGKIGRTLWHRKRLKNMGFVLDLRVVSWSRLFL